MPLGLLDKSRIVLYVRSHALINETMRGRASERASERGRERERERKREKEKGRGGGKVRGKGGREEGGGRPFP